MVLQDRCSLPTDALLGAPSDLTLPKEFARRGWDALNGNKQLLAVLEAEGWHVPEHPEVRP